MIQILHTKNRDWTWDEITALMPTVLPLLWKHREKIYTDKSLYLVHIPWTIDQFTFLRVGPMLKAWTNIDCFKLTPLDDEAAKKTMYVYNWVGSPCTGSCTVHAVCLETGETIRNATTVSQLFTSSTTKTRDLADTQVDTSRQMIQRVY